MEFGGGGRERQRWREGGREGGRKEEGMEEDKGSGREREIEGGLEEALYRGSAHSHRGHT